MVFSDKLASTALDRTLPVPLYSQLKAALLSLIRDELLYEGDPMPTEREICQRFQVSRITVRRAIDELAREGYIITKQGKGTFVAQPKIRRRMTEMKSFSSAIAEEGHRPGSSLLALRHEKVTGRVARALNVEKEAWVWVVERLRFVDDEPVGLSTAYLNLPADLFLTPAELDQEASLWAILERKGVILAKAEETIQAVAATDKQAELLRVPAGSPLLLIEGTVYTDQAEPVEYHWMFNRGDRYKYSLQMVR